VRLIDADALEKFLKRLRRELPKESRDFFTRDEMILNFQQYVHMQPTIDAVPVVRGKWEFGMIAWHCTNCKWAQPHDFNTVSNDTLKYCPNCGAKMEDKPCG
jgi:hypothetical protein